MGEERETKEERLFCPYCDEEEVVEESPPYCGVCCEVTVFYCPECREVVPRDNKTCPHCGAEIKG